MGGIGIIALWCNVRDTQGDTPFLELTVPFVFWVPVLPTCGGWVIRRGTLWCITLGV